MAQGNLTTYDKVAFESTGRSVLPNKHQSRPPRYARHGSISHIEGYGAEVTRHLDTTTVKQSNPINASALALSPQSGDFRVGWKQ